MNNFFVQTLAIDITKLFSCSNIGYRHNNKISGSRDLRYYPGVKKHRDCNPYLHYIRIYFPGPEGIHIWCIHCNTFLWI